ncbi:hypothetical protein MEX01_25330 [Methylorubrum extorquens]|uniref:hypothetical protein n=1 Tax=Methylorubrum extorquens TaxID=408 RepID=UPI00116EEE2E|nr:hypothetical protein [Methylorubrum extorquens]GEL41942.1 hypothetical protein MEX01_25330 [Methylorubrum extorquens]
MKNLTRDIVEKGEIFEYPLVYPKDNKFIIFDGNRRVTCLKLLEDPRRAPTSELQIFFHNQRALWQGTFPKKFNCQVETDHDRIDEILFRRHTGTQNGVGQSNWDDRMKSTFVTRTGKGGGPNVADEIESRLAEAGLLPSRRKIPRSTLNRLLSAEPFRQRAGFSMKGGKFEFTHDETTSLRALERIASDLVNRNIVLGDIWDVSGKQDYLNMLGKEGVLPNQRQIKIASGGAVRKSTPAKSKPSLKATASIRSTLIPQKEFGIAWPGRLQRHHQIWEELQFHLDPRKHPNATSLLLRVLIELALDNYIKEAGVSVHDNDKLAKKLEKAGSHLQAAGKIDAKQLDVIRKFQQGDKIISADTLNKYVHSPNFAPSPEHLMSMWDSLADIVVQFLKA